MKKQKHADKPIFFVCLASSILLFVGSFFCPPMGVIDPSCLKAGAMLLGFAALAIVGQNLANGKEVTFSKDDMEFTIGDDNNEQ